MVIITVGEMFITKGTESSVDTKNVFIVLGRTNLSRSVNSACVHEVHTQPFYVYESLSDPVLRNTHSRERLVSAEGRVEPETGFIRSSDLANPAGSTNR
jgi:hypothetical protein